MKKIPAGSSANEYLDNFGKYQQSSGFSEIEGFSLNIPGTIQIAADLSKVNYPDDYKIINIKDNTVYDPFCGISDVATTYRAEDIGPNSLPEIRSTPLPAGILKIAFIKDIWSLMNPSLAYSCHNDMESAWNSTLDRLEKLGVNSLAITPWTWFYINNTGWSIPNPGSVSGSDWTDHNVEWIVKKAKGRNLKVFWNNQIQGAFYPDGRLLSPGETTSSDVSNAIAAMEEYFRERGSFLQNIGVDGIIFGTWYWVNFSNYFSSPEYSEKIFI